MKKNSLYSAIVAGLAGIAGLTNASNAINLNPDGLGQVLIYPYYRLTLSGTLVPVKVRFLEARHRDEVRDFNLYLTPSDHLSYQLMSASLHEPFFLAETSALPPAADMTEIGGEVYVITIRQPEDMCWPWFDATPAHEPAYIRHLPARTQRMVQQAFGHQQSTKLAGYRPGTSGPRRTAG